MFFPWIEGPLAGCAWSVDLEDLRAAGGAVAVASIESAERDVVGGVEDDR